MRNLGCFAEADNSRNIQRARPHAALVAAAVNDRRQQDSRISPPNVERADSLRAVHLVRRQGSEIHVHVVHVERNLSGRLHGIRVEEHAALAGDLSDILDVLDHADFIVRGHDRDQDRLIGDRRAKFVKI